MNDKMIDLFQFLHYTPSLPSIEMYLKHEVASELIKCMNLDEKSVAQLYGIPLHFNMLNIFSIKIK